MARRGRRADFRFPQGGVDLTGLSLDAGGVKATGSLSLRSRTASAADLDLAVTKGALLDAGRIAGTVKLADAAGGPRASLSLTAENAPGCQGRALRHPFGTVLRRRADGASAPHTAILDDGGLEAGVLGGDWSW